MSIALQRPPIFDCQCVDSFFIRAAQASDALQIRFNLDVLDQNGKIIFAKNSSPTEFAIRQYLHSPIQPSIASIFCAEKILNWKLLFADLSLAFSRDEFLSRLHEHLNLTEILAPVIQQLDPSVFAEPSLLIEGDSHGTDSARAISLSRSSVITSDHSHAITPRHSRVGGNLSNDYFFLCLSLLKKTCTETYERTLLCSWLCLLIAKEMRLDLTATTHLLLASLGHDLGMLHVPSEILASDESLSPDEWLAIQQHVNASAYIATQSFADFSVATAIAEHHERCDGTGYPEGKVESELSLSGKILGLSDSVIAIFRNRFDHQKHSWREAIPIVQLNAQAYFFRHGEILGNLWRRAEMPSRRMIANDELHSFVLRLRSNYALAQVWFETVTQGFMAVGFTHGNRKLHAMQNVALHLVTSARGMGFFSEEFTQWLGRVDEASFVDDSKKIQDAHVNLQEIILHLQKLTRMLKLFLDESSDEVNQSNANKTHKPLIALMAKIKKILSAKNT